MNGVLRIPLKGRPLVVESAPDSASPCPIGPRHYLAGPENRLVSFAVEVVLARRHNRFNPLVLHGSSACGKSHLAVGTALEWRRRHVHATVVAIQADEFARDYLMAQETDTLGAFRRRYRAAELFVLEDLDLLRIRPAGQDELAFTLDSLLASGSQVIITSRRAPTDAPWLSRRLASRLAAGIEVPISLPATPTRRELLCYFAQLRGVEVAPSAVDRLAEQITGSARELLGALVWLETNHQVAGGPMDVDEVNEYLSQRAPSKPPTVARIAARAAKRFALKSSDLKSSSRRRSVVRARGVAMYLSRELGGASLQDIGRYFGGRDHTTVLHSCRRTEQLAHSEPEVRQTILALREDLASG